MRVLARIDWTSRWWVMPANVLGWAVVIAVWTLSGTAWWVLLAGSFLLTLGYATIVLVLVRRMRRAR